MQCEMCGRGGPLFRTKIEGTEMDVCSNCCSFGEILREIKDEKKIVKNVRVTKGDIYFIKENCGDLIKKKREKLGLKQEELANKLNIKESIIHKIENKAISPDMALAKKLEKFFNIKLIDNYKEKKETYSMVGESKEITIGDILKEKD